MTRSLLILAGPLAALVLLVFGDLDPANPLVTHMAAIAVWMGLWWLTEAVPLAITALLPVAFFPLLGIMGSGQVAGNYSNSIIMLFLGGFIIALAMERWNLHQRIALVMIRAIGLSPRRLVLGFMAATAFLSMWISNTAAAMMMVPIAVSVIVQMEADSPGDDANRLGKGLLLSIAYAASIGGLATLIGTPANMIMAQMYRLHFPDLMPIAFSQWLVMALPLSLVLLAGTWWFLTRRYCPKAQTPLINPDTVATHWQELGPMSPEEKSVLAIFGLTALLWLTYADIDIGFAKFEGWSDLFQTPNQGRLVTEGTVAIFMALLLFVIPCQRSQCGRLMHWDDLAHFPWSIFLLFGGGFALADGFQASGLSQWLSTHMVSLGHWPPLCLVLAIVVLMKGLSEFTSNSASIQMILPVLAAVALSSGIHPLYLMIPAALSASCPFMMPVATPPNAIIFGTERLKTIDMVQAGVILNLVSILLILAGAFPVISVIFGIALP